MSKGENFMTGVVIITFILSIFMLGVFINLVYQDIKINNEIIKILQEDPKQENLEFEVTDSLQAITIFRNFENQTWVNENCGQFFPLVVEDEYNNNTFYYDKNYNYHQGLTPNYTGDKWAQNCITFKFTPEYAYWRPNNG